MFRRSARAWLCIIVVVGAGLRLYGISAKSLWLDEALSWQMQRYSPGEIIARCANRVTTHPPLYFVLLHFWTRAFGDSETALRSLAALAGTVCIPAVYCLIRALMSFPRPDGRIGVSEEAAQAGLLASALTALSPLQIHLSQQTRGYTLTSLFLVISTIALLRALEEPEETERVGADAAHPMRRSFRIRRFCCWTTFVAFAAAAAYTHNLAVISIAAQCAFAASYLIYHKWPAARRRNLDTRWVGLVGAFAALTAAYFPWLPRLFAQSEALRHSWEHHKAMRECAASVCAALVATPLERLGDQGIVAWIVACAVAAVMLAAYLCKHWGGKYLAWGGTLPVVFLIGYSLTSSRAIVEPRYLAFAQLHWLCAAAFLAALCREPLMRGIAAAALVAASIGACVDSWHELGRASGPDMRAAVGYVLAHRQPGEMIAARGSNVYFELSYYARGIERPLLAVAERDRGRLFGAAHLEDDDLITGEELAVRASGGVWLVDSQTFAGVASKNRAAFPKENWTIVSRQTFLSDYDFEHPISVVQARSVSRGPNR